MIFCGTPLLYFEFYEVWPQYVAVSCIFLKSIPSQVSEMMDMEHFKSFAEIEINSGRLIYKFLKIKD